MPDTKLTIAKAFAMLAHTCDVDKITVKAIIDECHISRQTFYYHFENILELTEWTLRQDVRALLEKSLEVHDLHAVLELFVAFSVQQSPLLQKLMDSHRRPQVEKFLIGSMADYLTALGRNHGSSALVDEKDREVLLYYNVCGMVGVLLSFCSRPELDQPQLVGQLEKILSGELRGWGLL